MTAGKIAITKCMAKNKKQSEGDIQKEICQHLRKGGYLFWRYSPQTYNAKLGIHIKHEFIPNGLPDIMLLHPGDTTTFPCPVLVGLEVKASNGKPSAHQLLMQRRFGLANHEYYIVRSVEEVKTLGL